MATAYTLSVAPITLKLFVFIADHTRQCIRALSESTEEALRQQFIFPLEALPLEQLTAFVHKTSAWTGFNPHQVIYPVTDGWELFEDQAPALWCSAVFLMAQVLEDCSLEIVAFATARLQQTFVPHQPGIKKRKKPFTAPGLFPCWWLENDVFDPVSCGSKHLYESIYSFCYRVRAVSMVLQIDKTNVRAKNVIHMTMSPEEIPEAHWVPVKNMKQRGNFYGILGIFEGVMPETEPSLEV